MSSGDSDQWVTLWTRALGLPGGLAAVAAAIFVVLWKPAVNEVEAGFRVNFSVHHYSALDLIFVLLTATWLLIAIGLAV